MEENAYSGRWVARLRGRIIAHGGTPEQARKAALSRYKERPEIIYMPLSRSFYYPAFLEKLLRVLPKNQEIFLVGGAVRDLLLSREIRDYDFTQSKDGIKTARIVARSLDADFYPLDVPRDTGRVLVKEEDGSRYVVDFAAFRGSNLDADLQGRDFTMNAIALDPHTRQVFDPTGGGEDIRNKKIRTCTPGSFPDDPVRILRAVRFAANYGFSIEEKTRLEMKNHAPLLESVSAERIRDELFRILEGQNPAACLRALEMVGGLQVILPEIAAMKSVDQTPKLLNRWDQAIKILGSLDLLLTNLGNGNGSQGKENVYISLLRGYLGGIRRKILPRYQLRSVDQRSARGLLYMAALYLYVAKSPSLGIDKESRVLGWQPDHTGAGIVENRARHLALSNDEIACLRTIIRNHLQILSFIELQEAGGNLPSRRQIYRFFKDTGQLGVDLCLLALADLHAQKQESLPVQTWKSALEVIRLLLVNWYEKPSESISPSPLLDGQDIMSQFHLDQGPLIGELLESIRERQAAGEISTRDEALEFVHCRLETH